MYRKKKSYHPNLIKAIIIGYLSAFIYVLFSVTTADNINLKTNESSHTASSDISEISGGASSPDISGTSEAAEAPGVSEASDISSDAALSQIRDVLKPSGIGNDRFSSAGKAYPKPDELNLSFIYPEGADTSNSINSYAGEIFSEMISLNSHYYSSFYDLADTPPAVISSRLGLSSDLLLGKFNRQDTSHDPGNPSSWTVNSFKNINVSFYDGDGNRIDGSYCVQEIMSLANVYTYYHDPEDHDLFRQYCIDLFNAAVSSKISIGNVYYCPGCQKIAVETITEQSFAPTEADFAASDAGDAEIKRGFAADKQVVVSEGIPSTAADTAEDQSADTAADAAADSAEGTSATAASDAAAYTAENTSATAAASNNTADTGVNAAADTAATTSVNSITDTAEDTVPDAAANNTADTDSEINAAAEATAASEANNAIDKKKVTVTKPYCPGHVDLYVKIYIKGIDDNDSLFKADPTGNSQQGFNTLWKGWTADKVAEAKSLCSRNWLESYGLTISSIKAADELTGELTKEDIDRYIYSIKDTVSDVRESIVRFALDSVGRVPYYWGGKPNCGGYEGNNFGSLVSADNKGRILKGLDCSGWINWVYWSATGNSLKGQGTGTLISCGTKIETSELRPGDIVIRTGEGSHAEMFLCWSENGNIIVVHESGGIVNNVEVSEMSSNWPYCISLID